MHKAHSCLSVFISILSISHYFNYSRGCVAPPRMRFANDVCWYCRLMGRHVPSSIGLNGRTIFLSVRLANIVFIAYFVFDTFYYFRHISRAAICFHRSGHTVGVINRLLKEPAPVGLPLQWINHFHFPFHFLCLIYISVAPPPGLACKVSDIVVFVL